MNPYQLLAPRSFWRSAVAEQTVSSMSELWLPQFDIERDDAIVTAGSCFAQHIGRALVARGMNWIDSEPAPPELSDTECKARHYGVFSLRTGNLYTPAMLRQWLEWALQERTMPGQVWTGNGRFFDPLRPAVEPDGYASLEALQDARRTTLAAIRQAVQRAKVFVFTLGLTEAWVDRRTSLVYPVCPGTLHGTFDPQAHAFRNFGFLDSYREMSAALALLRSVNPRIRLLLTVSPVPLTATATGQHALTATTYSKSVLRAVAGQLCEEQQDVDYFPSYEIITGTPFKGAFYQDNQREVTPEGVAFVMQQFFAALEAKSTATAAPTPAVVHLPSEDLVCEDAVLDYYAQPQVPAAG
ncbi:GSCFA domain-containing protein [Pseudomonas gingeri]|uniref:GSCFA domain-containing protein n=1 Tax=Pseudomonas gingeri TaxID=117681 RepID=A0A7Y7YAG6_9PSED|nr:GSCFA domain-containing protein [Pseudomonas gingeri]NWA02227.1 GSCFA domain-containing protein [Pseudomonas gingeri]NWA17904.1 GSCFA domain-containing protein [Pseudomonas gingeri]NWA56817.1 GSCFA domain-containing protein [Pseudomonas gingeri]NWA97120.1 GSCFA domain-containing protein [Pseudomonas gingeri]NWB03679.1 GSCFA domain-containing protein [Pseudomonas gingeri]